MQQLTIQQVESHTDLPRRTIYYYIKEGLIPPPKGSRRNAMYGTEHVLRLWLIQALKEKTHLRLEGIKEILDGLSIEETRESLNRLQNDELDPLDLIARVRPSEPPNWLVQMAREEEVADGEGSIFGPASNEMAAPPIDRIRESSSETSSKRLEGPRSGPDSKPHALRSKFSLSGIRRFVGREKGPAHVQEWKRVRLDDGVEIHYRATDDKERDARIRTLINLAQEILDKTDRT